jgi:transcriptional antiterminator RfaH
MVTADNFNTAQWYAIHTHAKQEARAALNLLDCGLEIFAPKFREPRYSQYTGTSYLIKPLFPGYIFARFVAAESLRTVTFTRGVHSVVSFGGKPTPVDEAILDAIRSRIAQDGLVRMSDELDPGDEVIVKVGPNESFNGIFERQLKGGDRVVILLSTVNYQARFEVDRDLVKKAQSANSRA